MNIRTAPLAFGMRFKALTWSAIAVVGLFCYPVISTPADAVTASTDLALMGSDTVDVGGSDTFSALLTFANLVPIQDIPGATIDFTNATTSTDLGSLVTDANGLTGPLTVTFPVAGTFEIVASFAKVPGFFASSDSLVVTVVPAPTTPLPDTLPLFATGLGALGLLGWRRKRKSRVRLLGSA